VALLPLTAWLLYSLLRLPLADHGVVTQWIASGWHPVWLILTVLAMAWHSQLGVQVVIEDYVHGKLARPLLVTTNLAHLAVAAGGVYAVLHLVVRST
jgi:succinate dehydrogenase / fumarate reductase membrane anchor subunit